MSEPKIIINGNLLTEGQAMTLRVALSFPRQHEEGRVNVCLNVEI